MDRIRSIATQLIASEAVVRDDRDPTAIKADSSFCDDYAAFPRGPRVGLKEQTKPDGWKGRCILIEVGNTISPKELPACRSSGSIYSLQAGTDARRYILGVDWFPTSVWNRWPNFPRFNVFDTSVL